MARADGVAVEPLALRRARRACGRGDEWGGVGAVGARVFAPMGGLALRVLNRLGLPRPERGLRGLAGAAVGGVGLDEGERESRVVVALGGRVSPETCGVLAPALSWSCLSWPR